MSSQPLVQAPLADAAAAPERVYLFACEGATERALLENWLAQNPTGAPRASSAIFYARPRDEAVSRVLVDVLNTSLALSDETVLAPVRIAWLPPRRLRESRWRWRELLGLSNPRVPGERRKAELARTRPDRFTIVEGTPAKLSDLRRRLAVSSQGAADQPADLARFIARQAELALDHAEYRSLGSRYKVPRVTGEDVAATPGFREGVGQLAARLDRPPPSVRAEALEYLRELRTAHDPFVLDLAAKAFHWMYARSYGEVDVVPEEIEALRATFAKHPVLLLPSHKTNLDSPVVESVLAQNGLPPPTLFAGINMAFWPVGPLMRRAGRVFLRRKISDNPVYRFALREWLGYLIEKRFNLEWFPEGTRSRTGKLLPPKVGLLSYAAEAYRAGHVDDLLLVPMSIIYDQAMEVAEFAREAQGVEKKAEGFAWMLKGMREAGKPQGKVYLRIAEPLSMRAALGPPGEETDDASQEQKLALQKLALAVAWRTNQVTPITGISIVTFALLAAGERAVTLDQILDYTRLVVAHARKRGQPLTRSGELDTPEQVRDVLGELHRTGVVACHDRGVETLYSIAGGQHLAAAFYRNAMLHFVLARAIGELAVLTAAEEARGDRVETFHASALALREALKFEFFFPERAEFLRRLDKEMERTSPAWRELIERADDPVTIHRAIFGRGIAHAVLRPFIEAYHVVADALLQQPAERPLEEREFFDRCQRLGRQYLLQRALRNPESVSRPLFQTGLQLVRNLKLADPGPNIIARREAFAARSRASLARVDKAEDAAGLATTRTV